MRCDADDEIFPTERLEKIASVENLSGQKLHVRVTKLVTRSGARRMTQPRNKPATLKVRSPKVSGHYSDGGNLNPVIGKHGAGQVCRYADHATSSARVNGLSLVTDISLERAPSAGSNVLGGAIPSAPPPRQDRASQAHYLQRILREAH